MVKPVIAKKIIKAIAGTIVSKVSVGKAKHKISSSVSDIDVSVAKAMGKGKTNKSIFALSLKSPIVRISESFNVSGDTGFSPIDTPVTSDHLSISFSKIMEDTLATNDVFQISLSKQFVDTIASGEVKSFIISKVIADTVTITESFYSEGSAGAYYDGTDIASVNETISARVGLVKTDTVTPTDAIIKVYGKQLADIITRSDTIDFSFRSTRVDSVTTSDSLRVTIQKNIFDVISITESFNSDLTGNGELAPNDEASISNTLILVFNKTISDSVASNETLSKAFAKGMASDNLVVSESVLKTFGRVTSDTISRNDSCILSIRPVKVDALVTSEVASKAIRPVKVDNLASSEVTNKSVALNKIDGLLLNEVTTKAFTKVLADSLGKSDSLVLSVNLSKIDGLLLSEALSVVIQKNILDAVLLTETFNSELVVPGGGDDLDSDASDSATNSETVSLTFGKGIIDPLTGIIDLTLNGDPLFLDIAPLEYGRERITKVFGKKLSDTHFLLNRELTLGGIAIEFASEPLTNRTEIVSKVIGKALKASRDPLYEYVYFQASPSETDTGVVDQSQYRYSTSLTQQAAVSTQRIKGGKTIVMDGAIDNIGINTSAQIGSSQFWVFAGKDFCVEAYIRPTDLSVARPIASKVYSQFIIGEHDFKITAAGALVFSTYQWAGGDVTWSATSANGIIEVNKDYHVAAVREGTTLRVYCNGVQVATGTQTGTEASQSVQSYSFGYSAMLPNQFAGYINGMRITIGHCRYTSTFLPPYPASIVENIATDDEVLSKVIGLKLTTAVAITNSLIIDAPPQAHITGPMTSVGASENKSAILNTFNYVDVTYVDNTYVRGEVPYTL
jgi:hypothetical protein